MTSQNFEFVTNFRDLAIFSIYKNGETSDVDFLSSFREFVDFFSFPKIFIFCLFFQVQNSTSWSKNFLYLRFEISSQKKKHNL